MLIISDVDWCFVDNIRCVYGQCVNNFTAGGAQCDCDLYHWGQFCEGA